jgi:hypothetical protein
VPRRRVFCLDLQSASHFDQLSLTIFNKTKNSFFLHKTMKPFCFKSVDVCERILRQHVCAPFTLWREFLNPSLNNIEMILQQLLLKLLIFIKICINFSQFIKQLILKSFKNI